MSRPLVTIIIPVYNAEKYIEECIMSVESQNISNWQLILINDGSRDNSEKYCQKFLKDDSRIIYIKQENQGVAAARNKGIETAEGKWITFLDADDLLAPFALNIIENIPNTSDVVVSGLTDTKAKFCYDPTGECYSGEQLQISILNFKKFSKTSLKSCSIDSYSRWSSCGRFYKTDFLKEKNIRFYKGLVLGEDLLFCLNVYGGSKSIWICDSIIYYYRTENVSASRSFRADRVDNTVKLLEQIQYLISKDMQNDFYHFVLDRLAVCCKAYYANEKSGLSLREAKEQLKEICYKAPFYEAIKKCDYNDLAYGKRNTIRVFFTVWCLKRRWYTFLLKMIKKI